MTKRLFMYSIASGLLALSVTACGTGNRPPVQMCGTDAFEPVRVADGECAISKPGFRWYYGNGDVEWDDVAEIGEAIDDDYLGPDQVEVGGHSGYGHPLPKVGVKTTTKKPPATTKRR